MLKTKQSSAAKQKLAAELAALATARKFAGKPSLVRKERQKRVKPAKLSAYDLETTNISVGTPRPLYITRFDSSCVYESPIKNLNHLAKVLIDNFLTENDYGTRYVAWNGNRFDAYIVAAALVTDPRYLLHPYMTQSKTLRGLRVTLAEDGDSRTARCWEFLDGIAMTGLIGTPLSKFVSNFAPNFPKLIDAINFETETFNPQNAMHRAYAMRDSEGLYHAITRAQKIMVDTFNEPLGVTMGACCIKIFQAHVPRDIVIEALTHDVSKIVVDYVMRGGFCYLQRPYIGPVWKYDLNQAYAHAMRSGPLPAGAALRGKGNPRARTGVFIVKCSATNPRNVIPFYYRTREGDRIKSVFGVKEIRETWITSVEFDQLRDEGWRIECSEFYSFSHVFNMREFVDKLETLRANCEGGPSGATGTMIKATGNHSYGKTVEQVLPIEYLIAADQPDGFDPYYGDEDSPIDHVYCRVDPDRKPKAYHQPHVGAFVTALVRMTVRRAALAAPDAWIYADTDCAVFTRDVADHLDIDPKRYGAWKIEEAGTEFRFLGKKIYSEIGDAGERKAKGLNVRRLTDADFERWAEGIAPVQDQIQINNFLTVMQGGEMFRAQRRSGTRIQALQDAQQG